MENTLAITIEDCARELKISRSLAYSMARAGTLPGCRKFGKKRYVVSVAALKRYLDGESPEGHVDVNESLCRE